MSDATVFRNALPPATALNEYRLSSVLGAGAFGVTYLARDTHLERDVAIKEYLPADLAVRALDGSVVPVSTDHGYDYQWGRDRFLLEARTLARFSHPNIVRVNRYFEANGTAYMVMDYERGMSLAQMLKSGPAPDLARLCGMLLPLLDGLEAVHAAGFLHRDIKPANVFIRENGAPVLLDFGAARQALGGSTRTLTAVLTPGYAPLEQYSNAGHQGPWSDIYALGAVAYRALTGENPPDAVSRMRHDIVPERLGAARGRAGEALGGAIAWALTLDEKLRPQHVADWRRALLGEARDAPAPARARTVAGTAAAAGSVQDLPRATAPSPRDRTRPVAARRTWWGWAGAAVVLAAILGGAALWQREPVAAAGAVSREAGPRRATPVPYQQAATERPPRERIERPGEGAVDTGEVRRRALREFRSTDTDGDGFLSRDEVRRMPVVTRTFDRVDADRDGRISAPEFVELRRVQAAAGVR